MASILEALEMAQQRNKQRDLMNSQRQMPVLPIIPTGQVQPIQLDTGGGGRIDTRTPHEQYLDAIDMNKYVGVSPGGMFLGALNDSLIKNYELENPDKVVGGGIGKYSVLGRLRGEGQTEEEQAGTSLLDRISGNVPINWATQADYIGSFPEPQISDGGGSEGGSIGGYKQKDLSFDSFAGPTGYA